MREHRKNNLHDGLPIVPVVWSIPAQPERGPDRDPPAVWATRERLGYNPRPVKDANHPKVRSQEKLSRAISRTLSDHSAN